MSSAASNPVYESASRHQDVVAKQSSFVRILSPRVYTNVSELSAITADLHAIESLISIMAQFVDTHSNCTPARGGKSRTTGTSGSQIDTVTTSDRDCTSYYYIAHAPGESVNLGLFEITDASLRHLYTDKFPKDVAEAALGTNHTHTLRYDNVGIATVDMNAYQLAAFLRNMPAELYRTLGCLVEQLAMSIYKAEADTSFTTPLERATLVKLQDRICKQSVELASHAKVIGPYGDLHGPESFSGQLFARDNSIHLIRRAAPVIYSWLFEERPLGQPLVKVVANG